MSKGEVVVLDCWASPFCMRVKIALEEKGVQYEDRAEDLFGGKSELLLTSNPIYQKVPVLLHNEKPLCESTIIVGYIDETWPSQPLLPTCPYGRAQARFWADFIDKKVFDAGSNIWRNKGEHKSWFVAYEKCGGFKVEDHCPKFSAWMKRCMHRKTVAKVLPDPEKIYEFVLMLQKMNGIE
ncbi:hypothetical protein SLA2020_451300 [Shorea laevis]